MVSNEVEQMDISRLTVGDVMDLEDKDLDLLLENIRLEIEKKRMHIEKRLDNFENYNKKWEAIK